MTELPRLTSAEAAARLGIRLETLYAYVSRGRITRHRDSDGSTFDPLEVERLATERRRDPAAIRRASPAGTPLMILDTDLALIEDGRLYLRGQDIAGLTELPYEEVASRLWQAEAASPGAGLFRADEAAVATARTVLAAMPAETRPIDLIMVAARVFGQADPLRSELSPGRVIRAAGALLAGLIAVLPDQAERSGAAEPRPRRRLAAELWPKLTARRPTGPRVAALNAALVALFDHDLAVSTLAARAAASARADPYGVVSAGLAALDSALHGTASVDAHRLLAAIQAGTSVDRALAETLRGRTGIPGFGHRLYAGQDARATVLLDRLAGVPGTARTLELAGSVADEVTRRTGQSPNVDFALATLVLAFGMAAEAGEVIFACARIGGWIAHALDEYQRPPLRLRPTGRYIGP
ncbi:citrate synthase [Microlunatus sp. GCM10028923]|uniref:citrate synthase n=1 Tax=Microlunatus sp. GCM10028923 TaxID=3273400 RepID=UPI0036230B6A